MGFVQRHELWSEAQHEAAAAIRVRARADLDVVRLAFADQHGILRGKAVLVDELDRVLDDGIGIVSSLLFKDTSGRTSVPIFAKGGALDIAETRNAADMVMIPDPTTFRTLPWAPRTGWLLCDLRFANGQLVPFCSRSLLRRVIGQSADLGLELVVGLEVEFHLFALADAKLGLSDIGQPSAPPDVVHLNRGYQLLCEQHLDEMSPILDALRENLVGLGIPLRTIEVEFGPSQVELTVRAQPGIASADTMVLLRSAVKQVAARHGCHATFMCQPQIPQVFASGWHLHQSLRRTLPTNPATPTDAHGTEGPRYENAFTPTVAADALSDTGLQYLAGLLAHARGTSAFSTPTINGYKRFRPYSLAPDRVAWGAENRGAMVRVVGSANVDTVHIENRLGEPAANPYLYIASQLVAGLDGIRRELDPGPPTSEPYDTPATLLPSSLAEALCALDEDAGLREGMGEHFVDYYLALKRAEVARFEATVTDWEQREYFGLF